MRCCILLVALVTAPVVSSPAQQRAADPVVAWKAGSAVAKITPDRLLFMAGYAARKEPAEGTEQDLFAKSLAIEDAQGGRVVVVTLDLIGVLDRLRTAVAEQVQAKYQLPPQALLMNASHTHCGPAYGRSESEEYLRELTGKLVDLVGRSLEQLQPARISYSHARCGFAMNRRTPTDTGYRNHPNPDGLVDHSVPVLRVDGMDGQLRAVLFGYACHNTTMSFRKWLGDYAGYAQEYFEQDHPGATAHFLMGCGGDQNPYPRGQLRYAQQHGRALATAVEAALENQQTTRRHQHALTGPLKIAYDSVELEFATTDRPNFAYPVQLIQFGNDLCIVALASEVVVDYSLRLKSELRGSAAPVVWVAGYSHVYDGYIPSQRVLVEGGYEADSRPWKHSLEERIVAKVHELYRRLNPEE
jgi:hypothetical protein